MAKAKKQDDQTNLGRQPEFYNVPVATLETAVQIAALLINRDGKEPGGAHLLQKCGQKHVNAVKEAGADPEEVATWARAEARRRSPALDHLAIVAQRLET